ncbi:MAG: endonuclease/exonuclease/phosphatase family protein, partial [Saprospiraceae bacterium]|nr:endonuclease/exonuclease/phosphatase family protein [Saprospiraceae bacterium]
MKYNWLILLCLLTGSRFASGKVLSVAIAQRDTILEGKIWGAAGPYELIKGKIFFGTDPLIPQNREITDIEYAPVNESGLVLSSADIEILKPVDSNKSTVALVEVSNRGGKFTPSYFLDGSGGALNAEIARNYGDGLLLEEGVTIIWIGWQFDVPEQEDLLNFNTPAIQYPEGTPIIGQVRSDWTLDAPTHNLGLGHRTQIGYPVYDPKSDLHVLTQRTGRNTERKVVPRAKWDFGRWQDGKVSPDDRTIYSKEGFQPGMIYELVYYSAQPVVVGLGLSAIRDVISYAKYDANSVCPVQYGLAAGVSQTGRFLRQFLYQGFNIDEQGRKAYDGMMIITAGGGRGSFNHRFAQPSRDAHRYSAFFYPTDLFPFTGKMQIDPVNMRRDGILTHMPEALQPRIISVNTGYEYWGRSASLIHTDPSARRDIMPLENERIYHIASGQHFVNSFPPETADKDYYIGNPLEFRPNYRALFVALLHWVRDNQLPPDSSYPLIREGELVAPEKVDYPSIPSFIPAVKPQEPYRMDYGPEWQKGIIANQPPVVGEPFPVLVPQVDTNGNELGGIRNVELEVPLATYIPYSLRENMAGGNGEIADFRGTLIPFPVSEQPNDARPAIKTLYPDKNEYLDQVRLYLEKLQEKDFILPRDIHRVLERSRDYWNWINPYPPSQKAPVKMVSFNIRYDNPGDGESRWDARKELVVEVLDSIAPDFFGMQEALRHQCKDVERGTRGYRWIGVGRDDGEDAGEFSPIFYERKLWKVLDWGTFWLSDTPDVPSVGWDAALERIVTWGKFEEKKSGKIIFVFNTHFDHRGVQARIHSAKLISRKIKDIAGNYPFLLSGDFNVNPGSETYLTLTQPQPEMTIYDTKILSAKSPSGPQGTFSGFLVSENLPRDQIDYIFCS